MKKAVTVCLQQYVGPWHQPGSTLPPKAWHRSSSPDPLTRLSPILSPAAYVKSGQFADCVVPFLQHFPRHSLLFVNFQDLVADPEGTTRRVLEFVGADPGLLRFQAVPPKMKARCCGCGNLLVVSMRC